MYSSTLPSTSALDGGEWSTPRPGRFTPRGKTRYTSYRRLGRPQGRSGHTVHVLAIQTYKDQDIQNYNCAFFCMGVQLGRSR